jgi:hypothetical protein
MLIASLLQLSKTWVENPALAKAAFVLHIDSKLSKITDVDRVTNHSKNPMLPNP